MDTKSHNSKLATHIYILNSCKLNLKMEDICSDPSCSVQKPLHKTERASGFQQMAKQILCLGTPQK